MAEEIPEITVFTMAAPLRATEAAPWKTRYPDVLKVGARLKVRAFAEREGKLFRVVACETFPKSFPLLSLVPDPEGAAPTPD